MFSINATYDHHHRRCLLLHLHLIIIIVFVIITVITIIIVIKVKEKIITSINIVIIIVIISIITINNTLLIPIFPWALLFKEVHVSTSYVFIIIQSYYDIIIIIIIMVDLVQMGEKWHIGIYSIALFSRINHVRIMTFNELSL